MFHTRRNEDSTSDMKQTSGKQQLSENPTSSLFWHFILPADVIFFACRIKNIFFIQYWCDICVFNHSLIIMNSPDGHICYYFIHTFLVRCIISLSISVLDGFDYKNKLTGY